MRARERAAARQLSRRTSDVHVKVLRACLGSGLVELQWRRHSRARRLLALSQEGDACGRFVSGRGLLSGGEGREGVERARRDLVTRAAGAGGRRDGARRQQRREAAALRRDARRPQGLQRLLQLAAPSSARGANGDPSAPKDSLSKLGAVTLTAPKVEGERSENSSKDDDGKGERERPDPRRHGGMEVCRLDWPQH